MGNQGGKWRTCNNCETFKMNKVYLQFNSLICTHLTQVFLSRILELLIENSRNGD
jgi:hypothetical protein